MKTRSYQFGNSVLTLRFGDITESKDEVIVSSDDQYLTMGGGVSAAILQKAGNEIAIDASQKVPVSLADVVVTNAGRLSANYLFHAVTIGRNEEQLSQKDIIEILTKKCLSLLENLNLKSISFPTIGAGVARFSYDDVAIVMSKVISNYLLKSSRNTHVTIYLYDRFGNNDPIDYINFFEAFAGKVPEARNYPEVPTPTENEVKKTKSDSRELLEETEEEINSKRILRLRSNLSRLENQRTKIEEEYIDAITDSNINSEEIKQKLTENEEFRLKLLQELKELSKNLNSASTLNKESSSVFLSSTYQDLREHRELIMQQIARTAFKFVGMEHFGADPTQIPAYKIREEVKKCQLYIGVFGMRYGFIDQATGMSMTEIEYREAIAAKIPVLIYVISPDAIVKVSEIETSPEGKEKLDKLKKELSVSHTYHQFSDKEDLARQIFEDVKKVKIP
ncbi:MAG: DUF4062 domain-containing protein [Cytophagales bacterium]|nr:DUF4062 domain-containing protein [Cytophagales bacterium]